jgi:hypothetical protein
MNCRLTLRLHQPCLSSCGSLLPLALSGTTASSRNVHLSPVSSYRIPFLSLPFRSPASLFLLNRRNPHPSNALLPPNPRPPTVSPLPIQPPNLSPSKHLLHASGHLLPHPASSSSTCASGAHGPPQLALPLQPPLAWPSPWDSSSIFF